MYEIFYKIKCFDILDKMIDSLIPLNDEVFEGVQSILTKTVEECDKTITESNESLSPNKSAAINIKMFTEASRIEQENIKTILDIKLFLIDVKDAVKVIDMVLSFTIEIIIGHSRRLMKARNIVLMALDTKLKTNDSKLNVYLHRINYNMKLTY